jgi:hypothetical protein
MRRLGAMAAVAAVALTLTACGGKDVPSADHPTTNVKASQAPAGASGGSASPAIPSNAPTVDPGHYCDGQAPFTGEAADHWGADNVKQAYCFMVAYTLDESSWVTNLMQKPADGSARKPVEFSFVKQYMTSRMQTSWDDLVNKDLAGDEDSFNLVQAMTFYNLTGDGIAFPDRPDLVVNKSFSPAETWVDNLGPDGSDRLAMKFTVSGSVRLLQNNKPVLLPMEKTVTYFLVPTGQTDLPWVMDGFQGTYKTSALQPDNG